MRRTILILTLLLLFPAAGCPRQGSPATPTPSVRPTPPPSPPPWVLDAARLPAGSRVLSTVQVSRHFPLFDAYRRHHGRGAVMSAWQVPHRGRTWWAVDTRYTFPTEDDAVRFLTAQQAPLSEGHPLAEDRLALPCDPASRLFMGRIVHPGLGTPFIAFVVTGRRGPHVFKFLAAVELESPEPGEDALRADFLSLAALALHI